MLPYRALPRCRRRCHFCCPKLESQNRYRNPDDRLPRFQMNHPPPVVTCHCHCRRSTNRRRRHCLTPLLLRLHVKCIENFIFTLLIVYAVAARRDDFFVVVVANLRVLNVDFTDVPVAFGGRWPAKVHA